MKLDINLERDGSNILVTVRDEADDRGCYKSVSRVCSAASPFGVEHAIARSVLDFVPMPDRPVEADPDTLGLGPGILPCGAEQPGAGSLLKSVMVGETQIVPALEAACDAEPRPQFLMTYRDANGAVTHRIIQPSNVEKAPGRFGFTESRLLIAYDVAKGEPRTFRLDRIERLEEV